MAATGPSISARIERFPIAGKWTISRGSITELDVVIAEATLDGFVGLGECRPYPRYGWTAEGVVEEISSVAPKLARLSDPEAWDLAHLMPANAARNAVDCALWDLRAKMTGRRVWDLAGLPRPEPVVTAFSLSLDTPDAMQAAARRNADRPLLKVKLGGEGDLERLAAIREGAPNSRIIIDANEGWDAATYSELAPRLVELGVAMVEQPLPADNDAALAEIERPLPVCADESCHDRASLAGLVGKYDMINIKLDKTGGLTEALALKAAAEAQGFEVMVGCMLATSLAMAPAHLVAQGAAIVDLDGPLLLARDWPGGLVYEGSLVHPPEATLWG
ncbi:dipeptide epimerase [Limibaculum sp. M0105]|uniref:Dipeptide epimerase n=1 Tax=Thermohalobaculum xanthum TaxID=2753746 RepID=A0A8J7M7H8_9RHOB|nr:N-acetyl-D-Glu racemase DgcA [Thermohalobaculum xanthum]MBK0399726.1 dipeptide epimerase [Thermohalobaculum xanthum]